MSKTIVVTGASSGFGAMSARHLADAGHTVYAGMRATADRNAAQAADAAEYAGHNGVGLRAIEMDLGEQASVDAAVATILTEAQRIDVVVHNAGHMVLGPTEAFTPEQLADVYDTNVLSTQRVNRAVLPHLRKQRDGLLVWVGSTSTRGGTPPYLGPYFAAKAGEDSLAVSYAAEVARQIVKVVDLPKGKRPFRVHIDPANDGAEQVNDVGDRIRRDFYSRIGLSDLLSPA